MKNITLICMVIALSSMVSCQKESYKVKNIKVNSDTTIVLGKEYLQGNIYHLDLEFSGNLPDTIVLLHPNSNEKFYSTVLSEKTKNYSGDWYSDSCIVSIKNVHELREIKIKYKFYD